MLSSNLDHYLKDSFNQFYLFLNVDISKLHTSLNSKWFMLFKASIRQFEFLFNRILFPFPSPFKWRCRDFCHFKVAFVTLTWILALLSDDLEVGGTLKGLLTIPRNVSVTSATLTGLLSLSNLTWSSFCYFQVIVYRLLPLFPSTQNFKWLLTGHFKGFRHFPLLEAFSSQTKINIFGFSWILVLMKIFQNLLPYQKTWTNYENYWESKETRKTKNMTSMTEIYEDIYYS